MSEQLILSVDARALKPIIKSVNAHLRRLQAERKAALQGATEPTNQTDVILIETLRRLQGGPVDSNWWQTILDHLGHRYITPKFLTMPALQEWLRIREVEKGILSIAREQVTGISAENKAAIRKMLCEHYSKVTGEKERQANVPIDTVVSVLSAGFIATIPRDLRATTALIQEVGKGVSQTKATDQALNLEGRKDPLVQHTHTSKVKSELVKILKYRLLDVENTKQEVVALYSQIEEGGELAYATEDSKNKVRYWTARLCADSQESLQRAIDIRAGLGDGQVEGPLYVIDALIAANSGNRDRAMQLVRGLDHPDARSVMFKLLVQFDGPQDALTWSREIVASNHTSCFTHAGWRIWAIHMAESGQWETAANKLIEVESHMELEPGVALIEGIINAVLILPEELRVALPGYAPLYFGIGPNMDSEVEKYRKRAVHCFDFLATDTENFTNDKLQAIFGDWRIWLRLMSPNILEAQQAQLEIRERLEKSESEVDLVPFAWAFGIGFDHKSLDDRLRLHRRLGGLSDREMVAECFHNANVLEPRPFVEYCEDNCERLDRLMHKSCMTGLLVEALVRDGQVDRARELVASRAEQLDSAFVRRADILLENAPSKDRRYKLENLYNETKSIVDLRNLITYLEQVGDRKELEQRLQELFKKDSSPRNARRLLNVLSKHAKDHAAVLSFLDKYPELTFSHEEFRSDQALAKFHSGRIGEAKAENDALLICRENINDLMLDIKLSIASGEWDRLLAIVEREWTNRHDQDPNVLLMLAKFAGQRGKSAERALELAKAAVTKAPENPRVLMSAYDLHFYLGCEEQADPQWLMQALKHSTNEGPVWSSDFSEFVEHQIPAIKKTNKRLELLLLDGKLPIELFAEMLNVPLPRILLSEHRLGLTPGDGRRRSVIPTVSAFRNTVDMHNNWTVGVDITSLLVLERIGFLQIAIDNLKQLKITPDAMFSLFEDRSAVQFHQPALVRQAEQLRILIDRGLIKVIEGSRTLNSALVDEIGSERAVLLAASQDNGGTLVCSMPLHKVGSLTQEEADISGYQELLLSPIDILTIAHRNGRIDTESYETAVSILASQNQTVSSETPDSIFKGPFYLDQSALSYLQYARVLNVLANGQVDLWIHKNVQDEANALVHANVESDDLASRIEFLVSVLRNGLANNTVGVLPRLTDPRDPDINSPPAAESLEALISASDGCDALCVDDRFFNKFPACTSPTGTNVPVICVLDLLRHLLSRQVIDKVEYWIAKHKLRESGFLFVSIEIDELLHWLKKTAVKNDAIKETVELRTIRQYVCGLELIQISSEEELNEYASQAHMASLRAIRQLWEDSSVDIATANVLSQWAWKNLVITTCLPWRRGSGMANEDLCARFASLIGSLLMPLYKSPPERRETYRNWLERNIVVPMKPANEYLLERAVSVAYSANENLEKQHRGFLLLWFEYLPIELKDLLLKKIPGFADEYGVPVNSVIGIGRTLRMLVVDLVSAAKKVFEGKRAEKLSDLNGVAFSIELNNDQDSLSVNWKDDELGTQCFEIPEFSLMSSDSTVRTSISKRIIQKFGSTAKLPFDLLEKSTTRSLSDEEMSMVLRELTQGVAAIHSGLATKIRSQSLTLNDIVPQSLEYWERFCSPSPTELDPEEWIKNVLVPFRHELLEKDLTSGLDICCLGAIRDDLSPGAWIVDISDETVWKSLQPLKSRGTPFALLGALDVALHRGHDKRFLSFAEDVICGLLNDTVSVDERNDKYRLYQVLCDLILNRLPLVERAANLPSYWRRMCAWMQAGLIVSLFLESNTPFDVDLIEKWIGQVATLDGELRRLVDIREEPLVLGGIAGTQNIRYTVLHRLDLLKKRHARAGRRVPCAEEIDLAIANFPRLAKKGTLILPGPAELHIRARDYIPNDVVEFVNSCWNEHDSKQAMSILAWGSQFYDVGGENLQRVRSALEKLSQHIGDIDLEAVLHQLNSVSIVVAATGNQPIADLVGSLIGKIANRVKKPKNVADLVGILLQVAGAFGTIEKWMDWLDNRLVEIARAVPSEPNECIQNLVTQFESLEVVIPFEYWFHQRAKRIAVSGLISLV